jgi:LuxR family transcriptional regulator, maltose regulon positive regulatory protein
VVRPMLQVQLAEAIERHPLTVVAAPAGSGKTTELAQWAAAPGPWRPAWARLHVEDDDAPMLAWTLLGCLRSLHARGRIGWKCQQPRLRW